jgi:hypothetical protein
MVCYADIFKNALEPFLQCWHMPHKRTFDLVDSWFSFSGDLWLFEISGHSTEVSAVWK